MLAARWPLLCAYVFEMHATCGVGRTLSFSAAAPAQDHRGPRGHWTAKSPSTASEALLRVSFPFVQRRALHHGGSSPRSAASRPYTATKGTTRVPWWKERRKPPRPPGPFFRGTRFLPTDKGGRYTRYTRWAIASRCGLVRPAMRKDPRS